jgi:hypothetical protein
MDTPLPAALGEARLDLGRAMGTVGPHARRRVVGVQPRVEFLTVVARCVRHRIAPRRLVSPIDAAMVLITVVAVAMPLAPTRVLVFLAALGRVTAQARRHLTDLDLSVLLTAVALLRGSNNARVDDLPPLIAR